MIDLRGNVKVIGIMNSWGITITNTRKVGWWIWANPNAPAVKVGRFVLRFNAPAPTPVWYRRLFKWCNKWNGLTSIPTPEERARGFYIARPRPEWQEEAHNDPTQKR